MADYVIEKTTTDPFLIQRDGGWIPAWGLTQKSYPKANSDEEAIKHFNEVTAKCRTPYRIIKFVGFGYNCSKQVMATNADNLKQKEIAST